MERFYYILSFVFLSMAIPKEEDFFISRPLLWPTCLKLK
jgi:hypothetical protein